MKDEGRLKGLNGGRRLGCGVEVRGLESSRFRDGDRMPKSALQATFFSGSPPAGLNPPWATDSSSVTRNFDGSVGRPSSPTIIPNHCPQ